MNEPSTRFELGPVDTPERIHAVDTIRGFALLGVLLANINSSLPQPLMSIRYGYSDELVANVVLKWVFLVFIDSNFYTMFSLLFGAGFIIFLDRARLRGVSARILFLRRIGVLFLIGMAHGFLIWYGDILATYAVLGILLLAFADVPARRLWKWGVAIYLLPIVLGWIKFFLSDPAPAVMSEAARESRMATAEAAMLIYTSGSWWEVAQQRFGDLKIMWRYVIPIYYAVPAFGMFLIGAAIARSGMLTSLDANRALFRRVSWLGLPIGLLLSAYSHAAHDNGWIMPTTSGRLGDIALCLAYVATIVLFLQHARMTRWVRPLAPVGRMALTNYLLQSLVFTWVFCGYGFGLGDSFGRLGNTSMALTFFALQMWFSRWWLARYRFGVMEWLWRTMTYGRIQPLALEGRAKIQFES